MEEPIEQHQNQTLDHIEQLGFEPQPSDQNPNQNLPKADVNDDDDDEMAMQIIGEELQNLVLNQALSEEREKEDLYHLDRQQNEVQNVGWDDEKGGNVGCDHYGGDENGKIKERLENEVGGLGWNDEKGENVGYHHYDGDENGKIKEGLENEVGSFGWNDEEGGDVGKYAYDHYNDDGDEIRSGSGNGNENGVERENGYDGDSKEGGFNANNNNRIRRKFSYPLRPDAQDCPYYIKTGMCKFGSNCKFNHPSRRRNQQGTKEKGKQKEESQERPGQIECKYYLTSGGCKYGKACKYSHNREKGSISPIVEFNFLGLPIRPGEKECPYYMRTGSCKYGSNCRFHHPDPTTVAGADPSSGYNSAGAVPEAASHPAASSWSSPKALNDTASYVPPMMYPPTQGISSPNSEWNGYQAPVYPASEKRLPTPPAFMNNPTTRTNFYPQPQQPMLVEEYPERPGQPECSFFIKTGDCKYKSNCKFHHPKSRISKGNSRSLNEKGLPLRPDQTICSFYSRYGICKFGPACKFDHPENYVGSLSSTESGFHQPQQSQMSLGWQGRELEVDH